jgi:hypothetical protein
VCFDFLYNLFWNISHSTWNWAIYGRKCVLVFTWSTRYSCQILIKLEFSQQIVEKYTNIKFQENSSGGSRVVPCGRTDKYNKANSLLFFFLQFCKRA